MGRMRKLEELFAALRKTLETWKQGNPGRDAPGRILLRLHRRTSMVAFKSVYQTVAFAGYPDIGMVVETEDGAHEGVLWMPVRIPGPPGEPIRLLNAAAAPVHTMVLSVTAERVATTWKDGARVFTEDSYPRAILVEPTMASPETSPALVDAIRTACTLRGVPTDPDSTGPEPATQYVISVPDTEPYATLVALLDAFQAFREERPASDFELHLKMY